MHEHDPKIHPGCINLISEWGIDNYGVLISCNLILICIFLYCAGHLHFLYPFSHDPSLSPVTFVPFCRSWSEKVVVYEPAPPVPEKRFETEEEAKQTAAAPDGGAMSVPGIMAASDLTSSAAMTSSGVMTSSCIMTSSGLMTSSITSASSALGAAPVSPRSSMVFSHASGKHKNNY